jgi:hypothetical protein
LKLSHIRLSKYTKISFHSPSLGSSEEDNSFHTFSNHSNTSAILASSFLSHHFFEKISINPLIFHSIFQATIFIHHSKFNCDNNLSHNTNLILSNF